MVTIHPIFDKQHLTYRDFGLELLPSGSSHNKCLIVLEQEAVMLLSSWKEIAAYLHKGVRTAQRWEREAGLPIRRPVKNRHIIVAVSEELDDWVQAQSNPPFTVGEELRQLRARVQELEAENQRLRAGQSGVLHEIREAAA
jgi:hypothetical protein